MELVKKIVGGVYPFSRFIRQRNEALFNLASALRERDDARAEAARVESESAHAMEAARTDLERLTSEVGQQRTMQLELQRLAMQVERQRSAIVELEQIPRRLPHERSAFAHWGEDQVVEYFLGNVEGGFYVDIGCYHPSLCSNTRLLFARGWSGINIDANPFMVAEFDRERPDDVNLNLAIGEEEGTVEFNLFGDWASSNTASAEFAAHIARCDSIEVARRINIPARRLDSILRQHAGKRHIDFMNIDIESLDLAALRSNDWNAFRPRLLAIEDFDFDFAQPEESAVYKFMVEQGYSMISRCVFTSFFIDRP